MTQGEILNILKKKLAELAPRVAIEALEAASDELDCPLATGALDVLAGLLKKTGPDIIESVFEDLTATIRGDEEALYRLQGNGAVLSDIVTALQSAEAADKKQATDTLRLWTNAIRKFVTELAT